MFNYSVTPKAYTEIKAGNLSISLPVYGDLLGEEYDVIENLDRLELHWNQQLLEVTQRIATAKGLGLWEVSKLLTAAETAAPNQKYELLGEYVSEFAAIIAQRPSDMLRTYGIATAMLRRAEPDATEADVKKLPRRFLQQLVDFAMSEQMAEDYIPYQDLMTRYEMGVAELQPLKEIASAAAAITKKPKALETALANYFLGMDNLGKSDMQSE